MATTLKLYRGHAFLGGRGVAHEVRTEVERRLAESERSVIVLDFAGVEGVSHSFADELLSPLSERFDQQVSRRVKLVNVAEEVAEDLKLVADMHGLYVPEVEGSASLSAA